MKILALDPSTKSTGYAIYENQKLISHGCLSAGSTNLYKRIHKIINDLEEILKSNTIKKVIIEDVIPDDVHGNQSTYKALMYLQGFVTDLLNTYDIEFKFYTASEWRKKCGIKTGRGVMRESLKPRDKEFVLNQFGIKVNDDEADAICIGFAAVGGTIKQPQDLPQEYDDFEFL